MKREVGPVRFDSGSDAWLVTRHAECLSVLRDQRFSAALGQHRRRRSDGLPVSMLNTDPPEHRRLRSPAATLVSQARVRRCREAVAPVAEHFADRAVARREVDVIAGYAAPVAAVALAAVLGVPPADLVRFTRLTSAAAVNLDPLADPATAVRGREAGTDLVEYLRALIVERRMTPAGGISDLLDSVAEARSPTDQAEPEPDPDQATVLDQVLATLALVVVGGFEPLVHLIGNGVDTLLRRPDLRERLRSDPALWPTAIDELLRWESPIPFAARVCTEDTQLDGRTIAAGQTVITMLANGSRDPAVFLDPDRLDLARSPNPTLAFGAGPHICLGAPLARAVGETALVTALERFDPAQLLDPQPVWREGWVPRGLVRLPLRIG